MARAIWNGAVIAESDSTIEVEGNQYFPPDAVARRYLREAETHTFCGWKGTASYYDVVVDGAVNKDAAWYYPEPMNAAAKITNFVAFWRGVKVESESSAGSGEDVELDADLLAPVTRMRQPHDAPERSDRDAMHATRDHRVRRVRADRPQPGDAGARVVWVDPGAAEARPIATPVNNTDPCPA